MSSNTFCVSATRRNAKRGTTSKKLKWPGQSPTSYCSPSSMMRYFHGMRPSIPFSFNTASYEQTRASNLYLPGLVGSGLRNSVRACLRSSCVPPMRTALIEGHQRLNSLIQFPTTVLGTMTKCGPLTPRTSRKYASREMVCRVLPSIRTLPEKCG